MTRANSYLSDDQIETIKDKLLANQEMIRNKHGQKDQYCMDKSELADPVDEASINTQTSNAIRMRNRELFLLKKINKALMKIEKGEYGLCTECDSEINFERLVARTVAELCISCKEETEMEEKSNVFMKRSKSLGKTIAEIGKR
jgi:DnaK suppressor protein